MIVERVGQGGKPSFMVRVSGVDPVTGARLRKVVGTYLRRRDAERAEEKARVSIRNGTFQWTPPGPPKVTTVADVVGVWFDTKRGSITANSATGYESAIRLHILPALGERDVFALTHDDVQAQVNRWRDDGMGPRLLQRCVMVLRAALARQVKAGVLSPNPADGIEKPSARTKKSFVIWTPAQASAFLTEAEGDRIAPFWFLTLVEGMRRGEALGLRWADVRGLDDESGAVATIGQTVVPDLAAGGAAMIQPRAKTKGSQRTVALTAPTVIALKAHRDRQAFERRKVADIWPDTDLIVTTSIGTPVTPSTIKRSLKALCVRAGVPQVTTHGLRHQAATVMLQAGISPALVALKLGHADIGTTVDRYGHLAVSDQESVNAAMEAFLDRGRKVVGTSG